MRVAIHNTVPKSRPTEAEWAELQAEVGRIEEKLKGFSREKIDAALSEVLRPYRAELALREKETMQNAGMRINSGTQVANYKLPEGGNDDRVAYQGNVRLGAYRLPEGN